MPPLWLGNGWPTRRISSGGVSSCGAVGAREPRDHRGQHAGRLRRAHRPRIAGRRRPRVRQVDLALARPLRVKRHAEQPAFPRAAAGVDRDAGEVADLAVAGRVLGERADLAFALHDEPLAVVAGCLQQVDRLLERQPGPLLLQHDAGVDHRARPREAGGVGRALVEPERGHHRPIGSARRRTTSGERRERPQEASHAATIRRGAMRCRHLTCASGPLRPRVRSRSRRGTLARGRARARGSPGCAIARASVIVASRRDPEKIPRPRRLAAGAARISGRRRPSARENAHLNAGSLLALRRNKFSRLEEANHAARIWNLDLARFARTCGVYRGQGGAGRQGPAGRSRRRHRHDHRHDHGWRDEPAAAGRDRHRERCGRHRDGARCDDSRTARSASS